MHIVALRAVGYRNLNTTIGLCEPLSVIVGENNAGKSNVVDALRTVLTPDVGPRSRLWLREDDFVHDGRGNRLSDELELEVRLGGLSQAEQARMVTCLSPNDGTGTAKIRLKATIGQGGRLRTEWFGGDADHSGVERHARDAVRFVYLPPLRDAANDLRPGRDNKLGMLLSSLAPEGHDDREKMVKAATAANQALDSIASVVTARQHVDKRLAAMTGAGRFLQQTGLAFQDPQFVRVVNSLRAKIGQFAALEMDENGLGYNNLLYMSVLLAAIAGAENDEPTLRVLLVEEPEAHLHPQLQDLLMRFLETEAVNPTQVILTTHSPNFASSAHVDRLTVLAKTPASRGPVARLPRDFGLEPKQLAYLRRFLDVTKASLFFAHAVILVEGVAEQLLVPALAERLGRPLAPHGVAVLNIGGVAFPPFTDLFGEDKLPYRLAVISDGDGQPSAADLEAEVPELSPRAAALADRAGNNVLVKLAARTLEWDVAMAGNVDLLLRALTQVKPKAGPVLAASIAGKPIVEQADSILEKVTDVKGRFAQELAELISDPSNAFEVPEYLVAAIEWVTSPALAPDIELT